MDVTTTNNVAWTGIGAVLGAIVLAPAAAVVLPIVGLGALGAAMTAGVGAVIGGTIGYNTSKPSEYQKQQLRKMLSSGGR